MKRFWIVLMGVALVGSVQGTALAQRNARGKTTVDLNGVTVSIDYGRPSLHGRTIDQMLAMKSPTGEFWRLGADSSTTFTSTGPVHFGKVTVPKGTYSLWARKDANGKWTLVFNHQHGQWGTSHNPKLDFASVPLKEEKGAQSADLVTIDLSKMGSDGQFTVQWGDLKLTTGFTAG